MADASERFYISKKTVESHRLNLKQKLGVNSVNELVHLACVLLMKGKEDAMPEENRNGSQCGIE
ncbi:MAG: LuxR C-terminal-related transcriptional regulator [Pirellulaceae bacterium]